MDFTGCQKQTTNSQIVLGEKRTKLVFLNPNKNNVHIITVDNCLHFPGKKCDYLLLVSPYQIYVELKGSDTKTAIKQIENSILSLKELYKAQKILAYIVYNSNPLHTTRIQNIKQKFSSLATLRFQKTNSKISLNKILAF